MTLAIQATAAVALLVAALGYTAALFLSTDIGQLALSHFSLRQPVVAAALQRASSAAYAQLLVLRELAVPAAEAIWTASKETSEATAAWGRVGVLVGGPILQALGRLLVWEAQFAGMVLSWAVRFQLSLPGPFLLMEAGFVLFVTFCLWFKHFVARKQYIQVRMPH